MDPTEWPWIVKLLAGWGPLGVWVAFSETSRRSEARAHHRTRSDREKAIADVEARHQAAAVAKDEVHRKQLEQVTERMIRLVENQSRQAHRLADGVTERMRRKRRSDDDQEGDSDPAAG